MGINNCIPSSLIPYSLQILKTAITPTSYSNLVQVSGNYLGKNSKDESRLINQDTKSGVVEQLVNFGYLGRLSSGKLQTTTDGLRISVENTKGVSIYIPIIRVDLETNKITVLNPRPKLEDRVTVESEKIVAA